MGILFKVQNELGPSLLEKYYQRAIEQELKTNKLIFKREVSVSLEYQGQNIGRYFLDFVIEDLIILEIKAQQYYNPKFFKQALSYLTQTNLRYKRIINPSFKGVDLSQKDNEFE